MSNDPTKNTEIMTLRDMLLTDNSVESSNVWTFHFHRWNGPSPEKKITEDPFFPGFLTSSTGNTCALSDSRNHEITKIKKKNQNKILWIKKNIEERNEQKKDFCGFWLEWNWVKQKYLP
jgi:hypothetical protein